MTSHGPLSLGLNDYCYLSVDLRVVRSKPPYLDMSTGDFDCERDVLREVFLL